MTSLVIPGQDDKPWPTLGPQVCDLLEERSVYGPGDLRSKPYVVNGEFRAVIYKAYEVFPKGHRRAGRRRFKRVGISLRKGTAKTELLAQIAFVELHPEGPVRCDGFDASGQPVGRPVNDPYIPLLAHTEEQSEELAFGALYVIVSLSEDADLFDIGLERIMRGDGAGVAKALAGAPDTRDGARTTFQGFDEPLALDTVVPTPSGWRMIGELRAGDEVYGRDGRALRVLGASPVHVDRDCYRVTFSDGTTVTTDGAHRWKAIEWSNRPAGEQVVSTRQMLDRGVRTGYGFRWRLPRAAGFDGQVRTLPIDPYLLGVWLGDGSTDAGYVHTAKADVAAMSAGVPHTVSTSRPNLVRWLPTGLRAQLRATGLLGHKHIPDHYLFAAREQRLALLQGLMDTDGHTTRAGACTFVQNDASLAEQVAVLVRSLGAQARLVRTVDARSRTGEMWKVHFSPAFTPFRLDRKASRFDWRPRRCTHWPTIVSIEPVASVPVRCIAVDSDDHLFLIGRGLHLTHNTHRLSKPRHIEAHTTMLANTPKRPAADPWSMEITTGFTPGEGSIAERTYKYAQKVASGEHRDSQLFYLHRAAGDQHDIKTDKGLRAAIIEASGPEVAKWSDIDDIAGQFRAPDADVPYLERVWLNRLRQSARQAFDVKTWQDLAVPGWKPEPGSPIVLGFDGARWKDSTAIVGTDLELGRQWVVALWERPLGPRGKDWAVDTRAVDRVMGATQRRFKVRRVYADPPMYEAIVAEWHARYTGVREWWTHRPFPTARALRAYKAAMDGGDLSHDGDPRYEAHIGHAQRKDLHQLDDDGQPLWVIEKERPDSDQKIDLDMAGMLSWKAYLDELADPDDEEEGPPDLVFGV